MSDNPYREPAQRPDLVAELMNVIIDKCIDIMRRVVREPTRDEFILKKEYCHRRSIWIISVMFRDNATEIAWSKNDNDVELYTAALEDVKCYKNIAVIRYELGYPIVVLMESSTCRATNEANNCYRQGYKKITVQFSDGYYTIVGSMLS